MRSLLQTLRQKTYRLSPDQFMAYHPGSWVQYYDDTDAKDPSKALSAPSLDLVTAARKQRQKCAVCFSLQPFKGARTKEGITAFRNLGVDIDLVPAAEQARTTVEAIDRKKDLYLGTTLLPLPLKPHWLIETAHGFHAIFRVKPLTTPEDIRTAEEVNRRLVAALQGDDCASLLTQVLRVPGYRQFKDPHHPFLCRLLLDRARTIEPYDIQAVQSILDAWEIFHEDAKVTDAKAGVTAAPKPHATALAMPTKTAAATPTAAATHQHLKWQEGLAGVPEGQRNDTAASIAGKLLRHLPEELWETAGLGGLKEWNQKNAVPLPETELRAVLTSVARRERLRRQKAEHHPTAVVAGFQTPTQPPPDRRNQAQAERLLSLVTRENALLFMDQFGEPYAHVLFGQGHWRTCKLRGQEFREWLSQRLWEVEEKACSNEVLNAALNTLAGKARFEGRRIRLENRAARLEDALWYDLCDEAGRAVRITADGWEVVEQPPILFRHFSHELPQVLPVRGRPLDAFLPFVNLASPTRNPLLLIYLVTCFVPDIPHPISLFYGPQGSAKSTLTKLLRRLVDPSALGSLSFPDLDELPQLLFHHWFPVFDNITGVSSDTSDVFCRAVTGDGFSRRRLYSDDEDVIYHLRRPLCLNGINLAAEKPDLLDRCLLFPLDRIPEGKRQEERAVLHDFEAVRAELLGAIFDALSGTMRSYPQLPTRPLPRMADFARWGSAVAEAIGVGQDAFLSLYRENIREQQEEAIEASPVAVAVTEMMSFRREWAGTPTELLAQLERVIGASEGKGVPTGLPRRANALTKHLNVMKTNLAQVGILIDTSRRTGSRRRIEIRRAEAAAASTSEAGPAQVAPAAPHPDTDDSSGSRARKPSPRNGQPRTLRKHASDNRDDPPTSRTERGSGKHSSSSDSPSHHAEH